jgi:hypothetical protein
MKRAAPPYFSLNRMPDWLFSLPREAMSWSTATWCWKEALKSFLPIQKLKKPI